MKLRPFLHILKFELLGQFLASSIITIMVLWKVSHDLNMDTASLDLTVEFIIAFYPILIGVAYMTIFQRGSSQNRNLEFLFSRPVSRTTLYTIRTTLFACTTLLPIVIFLLSNRSNPAMIALPRDAIFPTFNRGAFYLDHFPGAFLKKSDSDQAVVLPHGQAQVAFFMTAVSVVLIATYQATLLGTVRSRWAQRLIPTGAFVLGMAFLVPIQHEAPKFEMAMKIRHHGPRFLESAFFDRFSLAFGYLMAWTTLHPVWTIAGLIIFCGGAFRYGCHNFSRQELPR